MAEEARLESVYASKAHPGFESPSLRKEEMEWKPNTVNIAKRLPSKNFQLYGASSRVSSKPRDAIRSHEDNPSSIDKIEN